MGSPIEEDMSVRLWSVKYKVEKYDDEFVLDIFISNLLAIFLRERG